MEPSGTLKARQIRAARALLDWSQENLAAATSLSVATIRKLEAGNISPRGKTQHALRYAFENAGLEFLEPDGVRHRLDEITIYQGSEGLLDFFDDIYLYAKKNDKEIVMVLADEDPFEKTLGTHHHDRMVALKGTPKVKCILTENTHNTYCTGYCEYRTISKHYVNSVPFYVYGNKYAAIMFDADPSPKIIVIQSPSMASAFRQQFASMWDKATPLNEIKKTETTSAKKLGRR